MQHFNFKFLHMCYNDDNCCHLLSPAGCQVLCEVLCIYFFISSSSFKGGIIPSLQETWSPLSRGAALGSLLPQMLSGSQAGGLVHGQH